MSHSQFHGTESFILRHAWLSLWDKHMTTGRINQVTKPSSGTGTQAPVPPRRGRKGPGLDVLWSPRRKAFSSWPPSECKLTRRRRSRKNKVSGPALRRGGTSRKAVPHARQLLPSPRAGKRCNLRQRRRDRDRVRASCKGGSRSSRRSASELRPWAGPWQLPPLEAAAPQPGGLAKSVSRRERRWNPETAALLRQQHTPTPHSSQSCCVLQRRFLAENFPVLRVHCGLCACACSGAAKFFKYFIFARYFGCSPQLGPGMQARLGYHKTTILARADETAWKAKIFVQGSLQVKQLFHLCKWFAH